MKIVFTIEAKQDLNHLRTWLAPLSPSGLSNVVSALKTSIHRVSANPRIGRPTPRDDIREIVVPKYGFTIPYYVKGNTLFILRVYNARREPLDLANLSLPKD